MPTTPAAASAKASPVETPGIGGEGERQHCGCDH